MVGRTTAPVAPKKRAVKSPAVLARIDIQAAEKEPATSQKEKLHAHDIVELLLDTCSRLQATEHYIQAKLKQDADATANSSGDEPRKSPCHEAADQVSQKQHHLSRMLLRLVLWTCLRRSG